MNTFSHLRESAMRVHVDPSGFGGSYIIWAIPVWSIIMNLDIIIIIIIHYHSHHQHRWVKLIIMNLQCQLEVCKALYCTSFWTLDENPRSPRTIFSRPPLFFTPFLSLFFLSFVFTSLYISAFSRLIIFLFLLVFLLSLKKHDKEMFLVLHLYVAKYPFGELGLLQIRYLNSLRLRCSSLNS